MEKKHPLPAFSVEGVRWDVLVVTLSLVLFLFLSILCLDTGALLSGGSRISKLNAGIASLEEDNSLLREKISRAAAEPFQLRSADSEGTERLIILSPAPVE